MVGDHAHRHLRRLAVIYKNGKDTGMSDLGQIAYEAYVRSCGGVSVHREELPAWEHQAEHIRQHWSTAARAVAERAQGVVEIEAAGGRWSYSLSEFLDRHEDIARLVRRLRQQQVTLTENLTLGEYFEIERGADGQVTALRPLAGGRMEYDGERYVVAP